jgi:hypothetical protein
MDSKAKRMLAQKKRQGKSAATARQEVSRELGVDISTLTAINFEALTNSDCGSGGGYGGGSNGGSSGGDSGSY